MASPHPCKRCRNQPSIGHDPYTKEYYILCRTCKTQEIRGKNLNKILSEWDSRYGTKEIKYARA